VTFEEFERRAALNPPLFRINEAHWAAEASILPLLLLICVLGRASRATEERQLALINQSPWDPGYEELECAECEQTFCAPRGVTDWRADA